VRVNGCGDLGAKRRRAKKATARDQHCNWDAVFVHDFCLPFANNMCQTVCGFQKQAFGKAELFNFVLNN
jgi:hypothetical protein